MKNSLYDLQLANYIDIPLCSITGPGWFIQYNRDQYSTDPGYFLLMEIVPSIKNTPPPKKITPKK